MSTGYFHVLIVRLDDETLCIKNRIIITKKKENEISSKQMTNLGQWTKKLKKENILSVYNCVCTYHYKLPKFFGKI